MPSRNRSVVCALAAVFLAAAVGMTAKELTQPPPDAPQFTADGKLTRPADYRRWIYVSSGFGMSYNPNAGGNGAPAFTNVFVNPAAYDYFQANGKWPDKSQRRSTLPRQMGVFQFRWRRKRRQRHQARQK
jgi:hypothetical protein